MQGKLITFEGIEGSGKTTQVEKLTGWFGKKGKKVVVIREPGGTKIGETIRKIVLDKQAKEMSGLTELFLFEAARAQLCQEVILPALNQGKIVLCDRFADSSLAYQGGGRGLDFKLIEHLNKEATLGLKPDLTFLLDLPVEIALARRRKTYKNDRLDIEKEEFHQRVRETYLKLAKKEPKRWIVIDGEKGIEEIHREIIKVVKKINFHHF